MYRKHNIWGEDKWDIHSGSNISHSAGSSSGYAGHSGSMQDYHKNEMYNKQDEFKPTDDYRAREQQGDKKKEDEEKTIVDTIEQEEKYVRKENQHEFTNTKNSTENVPLSQDAKSEDRKDKKRENLNNKFSGVHKGKLYEPSEKENIKSIEEAINEAIKEEKKITHVD